MDALAAYRAFLGLRTHPMGLEPARPVWWGGGAGVGGKRNRGLPLLEPRGAGFDPRPAAEMELVGEGLSGKEAPPGSVTRTVYLGLIPCSATCYRVTVGKSFALSESQAPVSKTGCSELGPQQVSLNFLAWRGRRDGKCHGQSPFIFASPPPERGAWGTWMSVR